MASVVAEEQQEFLLLHVLKVLSDPWRALEFVFSSYLLTPKKFLFLTFWGAT